MNEPVKFSATETGLEGTKESVEGTGQEIVRAKAYKVPHLKKTFADVMQNSSGVLDITMSPFFMSRLSSSYLPRNGLCTFVLGQFDQCTKDYLQANPLGTPWYNMRTAQPIQPQDFLKPLSSASFKTSANFVPMDSKAYEAEQARYFDFLTYLPCGPSVSPLSADQKQRLQNLCSRRDGEFHKLNDTDSANNNSFIAAIILSTLHVNGFHAKRGSDTKVRSIYDGLFRPLYGDTAEKSELLREPNSAFMRTSKALGAPYPPQLQDYTGAERARVEDVFGLKPPETTPAEMMANVVSKLEKRFVGDNDRMNSHVFFVLGHAIFIQTHNTIVASLLEDKEVGTEDVKTIFDLAKELTFLSIFARKKDVLPRLLYRTAAAQSAFGSACCKCMNDYTATVHDFVRHLQLEKGKQETVHPGFKANTSRHFVVPYETYLAYFAMHCMFPPTFSVQGTSYGLAELSDVSLIGRHTYTDWLSDLAVSPIGAMTAHNLEPFMARIFVSKIEGSRRSGLRPYADYLEARTGKRPRSFGDLDVTEEVRSELRSIYSTVDDIDWGVGALVAEKPQKGMFWSKSAAFYYRLRHIYSTQDLLNSRQVLDLSARLSCKELFYITLRGRTLTELLVNTAPPPPEK